MILKRIKYKIIDIYNHTANKNKNKKLMRNMKVGKYTYGHLNIKHRSLKGGKITIGKFCSIAKGCTIFTGNGGHRKEWITVYPFGILHKNIFDKNANIKNRYIEDNGDVVIGDDVWIGTNVKIMSGNTVGSGAIIAANSYVIKNVKPYSIVGGNPAKFIKYRFSKNTIDKLLEIKWWEWDEKKINKNLVTFKSCGMDKIQPERSVY